MIESNAWLVPTIAGLCLDICGVVILVGPLLKITQKYIDKFEKLYDESKEDYEKTKKHLVPYNKDLDEKEKEDPVGGAYTLDGVYGKRVIGMFHEENKRQNYNFYWLVSLIINDKVEAKNDAIVALIIIITGFILQIVGNAIK